MFKKLLVITAVLLSMTLGARQAQATISFHREWSSWHNEEWSECQVEAGTCGIYQGTRTRERSRLCVLALGSGVNECSYLGQTQTQTQEEACTVEYPACEVDVCTNLDGVQTETPEGYENNEGYCYQEEPEEPKDTPESTPSDNSFNKDTRCHGTTPQAPQWAWKSLENGLVLYTWSAMGGSSVDIEIDDGSGSYPYHMYDQLNDGHETMNETVGINQLYRIRVYENSCKKSDWTIDP